MLFDTQNITYFSVFHKVHFLTWIYGFFFLIVVNPRFVGDTPLEYISVKLLALPLVEVAKSVSDSGEIIFEHNGKSYTFRFFKFMLSSGEMEYLLTNQRR